jgi:hypothetical protein
LFTNIKTQPSLFHLHPFHSRHPDTVSTEPNHAHQGGGQFLCG